MKIKYKITQDIFGRIATNFVFKINEVKGTIYINKDKLSCNAKSMIGVLTLQLHKDEEVEILILDTEDYKAVKDVLSLIAIEI